MTTPQTPQGFRRILVPVRSSANGSSADDMATVRHADAFAAKSEAQLTLIGVVEPPADLERMAHAAGLSPDEVMQRLCDARRRDIAEVTASAPLSTEPTIEIRTGKTFIEVIRAVHQGGYDLVIKTAEKISGLRAFIFASTDQHLLRKCPVPVWLRIPGKPRATRAVLAAVDVDTEAAAEPETQEALNYVILQTALAIAAFEEASLEVLHVWDAPGEALITRWATAKDDVVRYRDSVESAHNRALHALVDAVTRNAPAHPPVVPRLVRGIARDVIPEHAEHSKAGVLVMGTLARTGVPGLLIGNTAEDVLHRVDCSVITVKPPGYVSPIA